MSAVRFARIGAHDLPLPAYATAGAAGLDLRACLADGPVKIAPGAIALIPTGWRVALAPCTEMQVRPRSGLAMRHGITLPNSPGTVDADYRGEIAVPLINLGRKPFTISHGDRIAQAVIAPVLHVVPVEAETLDETARGAGGFGSTGVSG